jgi:hypothetical protein
MEGRTWVFKGRGAQVHKKRGNICAYVSRYILVSHTLCVGFFLIVVH